VRNPPTQLAEPPEAEAPGEDTRERGGVQSIERAFRILEEIARNRQGIGLSELSRRVGLHNSTAFHLVKTMVALGYVRQLADSKRYSVGRPLFALAASCLDDIELVRVATPVLETLSRATGECSHIAVRSGDNVVIVARTAGTGAFQMTDRVGVVRPAYCTGLGKVLLAALTDEQLDRYLEATELRPLTPRTITDRARLREEIVSVRRLDMAFDDCEFDAEVRCVAVPVRDFSGQVTGAIGISGPIWRLSVQALQERAVLVAEAARSLSAEFGHAQPGD